MWRLLLILCPVLAACAGVGAEQSRVIAPNGLPPVAMTDALGAAAHMAVQETLKDPESAQFRPSRWAYRDPMGGVIICGQVNAKNSYGGYVGFAPFYALVSDSGRPIYAKIQENTYIGQQVFMNLYPLCAGQ